MNTIKYKDRYYGKLDSLDSQGVPITYTGLTAEEVTHINSLHQLAEVRLERNKLLLECDWVMLMDNHVTESKKAEFVNYRQQLRDITEPLKNSVATFSQDVVQSLPTIVWPVKPEL